MHSIGRMAARCPFNMDPARPKIVPDNTEIVAYTMKFHVEATGIAHGLSFCIPAPEGGGCGLTIGTRQTHSS